MPEDEEEEDEEELVASILAQNHSLINRSVWLLSSPDSSNGGSTLKICARSVAWAMRFNSSTLRTSGFFVNLFKSFNALLM